MAAAAAVDEIKVSIAPRYEFSENLNEGLGSGSSGAAAAAAAPSITRPALGATREPTLLEQFSTMEQLLCARDMTRVVNLVVAAFFPPSTTLAEHGVALAQLHWLNVHAHGAVKDAALYYTLTNEFIGKDADEIEQRTKFLTDKLSPFMKFKFVERDWANRTWQLIYAGNTETGTIGIIDFYREFITSLGDGPIRLGSKKPMWPFTAEHYGADLLGLRRDFNTRIGPLLAVLQSFYPDSKHAGDENDLPRIREALRQRWDAVTAIDELVATRESQISPKIHTEIKDRLERATQLEARKALVKRMKAKLSARAAPAAAAAAATVAALAKPVDSKNLAEVASEQV